VTSGRVSGPTVELARKTAREVLVQALAGENPALQRNTKRLEMRMVELVDLYEADSDGR
jgi:hypothetical protein